MYGCFVTEPVNEDADLGVLFFHNAGFSTACGHGTIALATYALEAGLLPASSPRPSSSSTRRRARCRSWARWRAAGGAVRFRNVPAYVWGERLRAAGLDVDVAFGGAFYASVASSRRGVEPRHLPALIELGREVKRELEAEHDIVHGDEPELRDIYGVIFFQTEGLDPLTQRNVAIFADGEVDRSPCGSGTSARLALLHAHGELEPWQPLLHRSIAGTEFWGRVVEETPAGVVTEISGSAHRTGEHRFVLEPDDPLGTGFLLR